MNRWMILAGLGVVLSTLCGASASFAKSETCRAEMDKFCKDVPTGQGRVLKCLQEHQADLSAECRAYVNTAAQYVVCLDDIMRLCPKTQPGGARGMKCLRSHQGELSDECKRELSKSGR